MTYGYARAVRMDCSKRSGEDRATMIAAIEAAWGRRHDGRRGELIGTIVFRRRPPRSGEAPACRCGASVNAVSLAHGDAVLEHVVPPVVIKTDDDAAEVGRSLIHRETCDQWSVEIAGFFARGR